MQNPGADIYDILRRYWGYEDFRPLQREIIENVLAGHDTLGLLPTGGGKSITFQVPALALDGLTIVVTPLISLMKDQVDNLRSIGVKAAFLHSGMPRREGRLALDRCRLGKIKILYVSPERLNTPAFISEIRTWDVSMIVVDEAHCISQWGYDFRPSYLRIALLRQIFPDIPLLALTASATPEVVEDIKDKLAFKSGSAVFSRSFRRDNISFLVRNVDSKKDMLLKILSSTSGSSIVYVRSRKRARELAVMLQQEGISADFYHAGLSPEEKDEKQNRWKTSAVRVMVATNAFGMGIDKSDVRVVVHVDIPSSIEEYYQEAGRAGRDGLSSFAVIVTSRADKATLSRRISDSFPPKEKILEIYDRVGVFLDIAVGCGYNEVFDFNENEFCARYDYKPAVVRSALTLLSRAGYIDYADDVASRARVMFTVRKEELYNLPIDSVTDAVLMTLMRLYSGLFSDYVYISESRVASMIAGTTENDVYNSLLTLQRMKVLHYIPRRLTPYIYYATSRELSKYVILPREIYEVQKERLERRINAMKDFVYDDSRCREEILLDYFGEKGECQCGKCDYCRSLQHKRYEVKDDTALRQFVIYRCSRNDGCSVKALLSDSPASSASTMKIIREMLDEGEIKVTDTIDNVLKVCDKTPEC